MWFIILKAPEKCWHFFRPDVFITGHSCFNVIKDPAGNTLEQYQEAVCVHFSTNKVSWGIQRHLNQHAAFENGTMQLHGVMAVIALY